MASADIHHIGDAAIGGMDAENLMHYSEVIRESANLQSCGCRLAIFVNEQNNKI